MLWRRVVVVVEPLPPTVLPRGGMQMTVLLGTLPWIWKIWKRRRRRRRGGMRMRRGRKGLRGQQGKLLPLLPSLRCLLI